MPTYILDLLVRRAQIRQACNRLVRPVWLMIKSDGVHQAFNTKSINPSDVLQWDAPARLILNIQNFDESVLQVSLCTLNESYNQNLVVASSQILLSSLPSLNPKTISFPLMSSYNITETAAIVTMTATISQLPNVNDHQKSQYSSPSMQQPYYNQNQQSPYSDQYGQNQRYQSRFHARQQANYQQQDDQYDQEPANNQFYQQSYPNQQYFQPQQEQYSMPVNPYKMQNSHFGQSSQKKVHYPPFPPIQPDSSVFPPDFDGGGGGGNGYNQQMKTPKVIRSKRKK